MFDSFFLCIQLDLFTFMPVACMLPDGDFATVLYMSTLIPLGVMIPLALAGRCLKKAQLLNVVFEIIFLIFPATSTKIFSTFQCFSLDDG